jgi:hypothetical protein
MNFFTFKKLGRTLLLVAVLVLVSQVVNTQAQSKPIMGYDKLKWGASVEDVRKTYGIGNDVSLVEDEDPNIARLIQKDVSESITKREFLFNKWGSNNYKLYRVWVTYKGGDGVVQNLVNLLTSKFGKVTDQGDWVDGTRFIGTEYTFGKYSPELVVELLGSNSPTVCYTWKKFRDNYNAKDTEL